MPWLQCQSLDSFTLSLSSPLPTLTFPGTAAEWGEKESNYPLQMKLSVSAILEELYREERFGEGQGSLKQEYTGL